MLSSEPLMTIWAQPSDPLAVQPEKVVMATSTDAIAIDTAPPVLAVEQLVNAELDMLIVCTLRLSAAPAAYSDPLESCTRSRSKLDSETRTPEACVTCTTPSWLSIPENRECAIASRAPLITICPQLSDPTAVQLSKTELFTSKDDMLIDTAPPLLAVKQSRKVELDMIIA